MDFKIIEETIVKTQGVLKEFDNIQGVFGGYVAVYGNKDRQGDIIQKNAFKDDVENFYKNEKTVAVYHEHDPYLMLATKPLELKSDDYGVYGTFKVDEKAKEIHKSIWEKLPEYYSAGILSFSIGIQKAMTTPLKGGRYIIHKGIMKEFSTTITPANPKAKVNIMKNMEDFESILKNITSFSRAEEFLRKNTDLTQSQCTDFLRAFQNSIEKRNSSPAQDCPTNDPAQAQNNLASFLGEVEKHLTK